ncbi:MAG: hypothetical protein SF029_08165 [bacterium]|nr:hypothetical protein [bacterium]
MAFDFEALVGNLYVVGGRSISAPPPGALVEVAPRKAARGREADTFFALVLPSGDAIAPALFYEQMAKLAAERYFNSTGSVTSGLREVFNTINRNLVEHNTTAKRTYEANMLCAVMRGADLIVGRIGPGVVILRHENQTRTFPENLEDDEALYTAPLGVQETPNVKMTQYRVAAGTRLIMGDSNLAEFTVENFNNVLLSAEFSDVLIGFKDLAKLQLTLVAAEFVPPEEPVAEAVLVGESTAQFTASGKVKTATSELKAVSAAAINVAVGTDPSAPAGLETPAPEAAPARPKREPRESKAAAELQRRANRTAGSSALLLSRFLAGISRLLNQFFPPPQEGQRTWFTSPLAAGLVVLLPVGVVGMVMMLWLSGTGESEFELCREEALRRTSLARSVPSQERQTVLSTWALALEQVDLCLTQRPDDPTLLAFMAEGQGAIDALMQITRRDVYPIETFVGASLKNIVIHSLDLYVLDSAISQVYQVQLTEDGRQRASVGRAVPDMRRGAVVNGYAVDEIIDIAYSEQDNLILALDRSGVLVGCSPAFLQCEAQQLIGVENWSSPVAIATWSGRLYVLDAGAGEIWRYEPSGDNAYANAPSEYFGGQSRLAANTAVDFEIEDDTGSIYVLLAQGVVRKFRGGQQEELSLVMFPIGQELSSAVSMYLDDNPIVNMLYLISREQATIYEVTRGGNFSAAFRPRDESLFALVSAIATSPGENMIYAVSGNAILAFEKGR